MFRGVSLFNRFCSQLIKTNKNSINPVSEHIAFGHYFPKEWTEKFISEQLDPTSTHLKEVQIIKNKMGKPSGKILLKFTTAEAMKDCIERYNQDFIITKEESHRVIIQPFELKTKSLSKENTDRKTKHQVKLKNLDFDISVDQLERLARDFGKVEYIEMQVRPNGLNNGMASIYFSRNREAQDFSYFADGLLYKDRKLKSEVIQYKPKDQEKEAFLVEPKVTLESHDYIFRKLVSEQKNTQS